jgi:hypothetical protein
MCTCHKNAISKHRARRLRKAENNGVVAEGKELELIRHRREGFEDIY